MKFFKAFGRTSPCSFNYSSFSSFLLDVEKFSRKKKKIKNLWSIWTNEHQIKSPADEAKPTNFILQYCYLSINKSTYDQSGWVALGLWKYNYRQELTLTKGSITSKYGCQLLALCTVRSDTSSSVFFMQCLLLLSGYWAAAGCRSVAARLLFQILSMEARKFRFRSPHSFSSVCFGISS